MTTCTGRDAGVSWERAGWPSERDEGENAIEWDERRRESPNRVVPGPTTSYESSCKKDARRKRISLEAPRGPRAPRGAARSLAETHHELARPTRTRQYPQSLDRAGRALSTPSRATSRDARSRPFGSRAPRRAAGGSFAAAWRPRSRDFAPPSVFAPIDFSRPAQLSRGPRRVETR